MKENEHCTCRACGNGTIARKYRAGNDFLTAEYRLCCALCGADLGKIDETPTATSAQEEAAKRFSALLGGETTRKVEIERGDGYRRGCRNCKNFISHPFKAVCGVTGEETDPMRDCENFVLRGDRK